MLWGLFGGKTFFMIDLKKDRVKKVSKMPRNAKLIVNGKDRELHNRMQNGNISENELGSLCFESEAAANWVLAAHRQNVQRKKPKVPPVQQGSVAQLGIGQTSSAQPG